VTDVAAEDRTELQGEEGQPELLRVRTVMLPEEGMRGSVTVFHLTVDTSYLPVMAARGAELDSVYVLT
jgi:hypothetical protein